MKQKKLISKGSSNAKLAKDLIESHILYLAPFDQNSKGINLCPSATPACKAGCIFWTGRAAIYSSVNAARMRRTEFMLSDRIAFYKQLGHELKLLNKKAAKKNGRIAVRLNGTSDVDHLAMLASFGKVDWRQLDRIQFYDYTKVAQRIEKYKGTAYDLTFSRSENNEEKALELLARGERVAIVFRTAKMPSSYLGYPVVNGDATDARYADPKGCWIGLKAKGKKAKADTSGFVVDATEQARQAA